MTLCNKHRIVLIEVRYMGFALYWFWLQYFADILPPPTPATFQNPGILSFLVENCRLKPCDIEVLPAKMIQADTVMCWCVRGHR